MAYNKEAQAKYRQKCKNRTITFFPDTDKDIEDYLVQTTEPFSTLVKRLIRAEIAAKSQRSQDN